MIWLAYLMAGLIVGVVAGSVIGYVLADRQITRMIEKDRRSYGNNYLDC